DWAAPCTPSSLRLGSTRTTPSSAVPAPSLPARRSSRESTEGRASWLPTSAMPHSAAVPFGKASRLPAWTNTGSSGTHRWAEACQSSSIASTTITEWLLHQQPLRNGRPDLRGNDGMPVHRPHWGGSEPGTDACGARQRIRPAGRDRRPPAQEAPAARGQRAGAAGHHHLPDQRPLAVRCFELPGERRNRALARGRFDQSLPPQGRSEEHTSEL